MTGIRLNVFSKRMQLLLRCDFCELCHEMGIENQLAPALRLAPDRPVSPVPSKCTCLATLVLRTREDRPSSKSPYWLRVNLLANWGAKQAWLPTMWQADILKMFEKKRVLLLSSTFQEELFFLPLSHHSLSKNSFENIFFNWLVKRFKGSFSYTAAEFVFGP